MRSPDSKKYSRNCLLLSETGFDTRNSTGLELQTPVLKFHKIQAKLATLPSKFCNSWLAVSNSQFWLDLNQSGDFTFEFIRQIEIITQDAWPAPIIFIF